MHIARFVGGLAILAACGSVGGGPDATVTHTLTVTPSGNGSGVVTSSPAGIDCGTDCSEDFTEGTTVTLSATTGAIFTGWSGGGCTGTDTCIVTLAAAATVTATFTLPQHALKVSKAGTATGIVTSSVAGISCGATCEALYDEGTTVVLAASPAGGSVFAGWSGGGCTGLGTCTVTITAAATVTAMFSPPLSCTTIANAMSCTNGVSGEISLGAIASTACHDQCQNAMAAARMSSGCWVLALNGICYCRSGTLGAGGAQPGGACN